jgi:nucleoside-diphosphate-sugar epimerase
MSKKIFCTGCSGFVGRHLANRLIQDGHDVHALVRHVADRTDQFEGLNVHFGDFRDSTTIAEILDKVQPEVIIHLASQTSVEYSFTHEEEVMDLNLAGSNMLASVARKHCPKLEKYIFASSVETYGNQTPDRIPIKETNVQHPASPYGVAKLSHELYLKYLYQGYKFPMTMLRSTNTYGRRFRRYNFVIEHILSNMMKWNGGSRFINMGYMTPVRDYLHVDDEVEAYIALIENPDVVGQVFNTGTGRGLSVSQLFYLIQEKVVKGGDFFEPIWNTNSPRGFEICNLTIDATKLTEWTGWKPKISLEEGIKRTMELNSEWLVSG